MSGVSRPLYSEEYKCVEELFGKLSKNLKALILKEGCFKYNALETSTRIGNMLLTEIQDLNTNFKGVYSVIIHKLIFFDKDVVSNILYTSLEYEEDEEDAYRVVIDSLFPVKNEVLLECCPSKLKSYKWVNIENVSVSLLDKVNELSEGIYKISMDDIVNIPKIEFTHSGYRIEDSMAYNITESLLNCISKPIKEAYIIVGDEDIKGKMVYRECDDGEIVVTIY